MTLMNTCSHPLFSHASSTRRRRTRSCPSSHSSALLPHHLSRRSVSPLPSPRPSSSLFSAAPLRVCREWPCGSRSRHEIDHIVVIRATMFSTTDPFRYCGSSTHPCWAAGRPKRNRSRRALRSTSISSSPLRCTRRSCLREASSNNPRHRHREEDSIRVRHNRRLRDHRCDFCSDYIFASAEKDFVFFFFPYRPS